MKFKNYKNRKTQIIFQNLSIFIFFINAITLVILINSNKKEVCKYF